MPRARKSTGGVIRFGGFELDPRTGELQKGDLRVGDTFVDFEHGLNAAVKRLREALGDSAEDPRFVETLPRRGYRFIAPLEADGTRSGANGDSGPLLRELDERPLEVSRKAADSLKRRPGWLIGAGIAGIAIASFGNGQWIYFSWDQGGVRDIWRVHLERGTREQLTRAGGGLVARESADGLSVLYQPKAFNTAVQSQPLAGGAPHTVIPCVTGTAYSVLPEGIYFIPCVAGIPPEPNPPVKVLNTATGEVREIGRLENYQHDNVPSGFAVSADGRNVFYARLVSRGADLMLIEHFR